MPKYNFSRRDFFKSGAIGGASLMLGSGFTKKHKNLESLNYSSAVLANDGLILPSTYALDLTPAQWIWYPSQRTLANTFILFRKSITVQKEISSAKGWILGDSRYELSVNGKRIQWGPPPSDPRFSEADPLELDKLLTKGENVIGATVLYYGYGDGTWPVGKPGFIFYLKITFTDGSEQTIISDENWDCHLARSWKPGQYKRWYLRALQEEFDSRSYPYGWTNADYSINKSWIKASNIHGLGTKPALSAGASDYMNDSSSGDTVTELRKRSIPMLVESDVHNVTLQESYWVKWHRPPQEYFEMITPDAFEGIQEDSANPIDQNAWEIILADDEKGAVLTFSLDEQIVGWPFFTIQAPSGTIVEMMVQEGHKLFKDGGPAIMNNHFHSWSRFICQEGENHFHPFDFESVKWIQLHIHGQKGKIVLKNVGMKRRLYNWPNSAKVKTSDKDLQKLINACINTIYNNSQETIVDGMARERQQYSGDLGHMLHGIHRVFGENQLPARFVNTYSQGITLDGYFLDTWPAFDRLNRLTQRQLGLTKWGPLLDHGVGFNFDCYYYYLYTGDLEALNEVWPRLKRFNQYLKSIVGEDGLLPVENLGIPAVWIDHEAYEQQRHKQCAFNLYAAAMMKNAFGLLAEAKGEYQTARDANAFSYELLNNTISKYWDTTQKLFVCNKPWVKEEGKERMCDRSLSTAILFDLCPYEQQEAAISALVNKPENMGLSYPTNANWYLWALGKAGKIDIVFQDFQERWIKMDSVHQNNTMQEFWNVIPDSGSQWSHASIAPLFSVYMDIAGIRPIEPAYKQFQIHPQPGNLEYLELENYTPFGPIGFLLTGKKGNRLLKLKIPINTTCQLVLDEKEKIKLNAMNTSKGKSIYEIKGGKEVALKLKFL